MTNPAHVLVVDDDSDLRVLMTMVLEHAGFHVTSAADGRAALDEVHHRVPDLILLDMRMPRMDGWEFARALDDCGIRAPIVVLSAATDAAARAAEIHADGWLAKPFDLDKLVPLVSRLAHQRPD